MSRRAASRRARADARRAAEQPAEPAPGAPAPRARLDQWLWRARFFKTRALAAATVAAGRIRVNGERAAKPGCGVKCGDVLTFARAGRVHVVEIRALGERRGPAPEARALYADLSDADPEQDRAEDGDQDGSLKPPPDAAAPNRPLDETGDLA